jgi:hypothetical protein
MNPRELTAYFNNHGVNISVHTVRDLLRKGQIEASVTYLGVTAKQGRRYNTTTAQADKKIQEILQEREQQS